MSKIQEKRQKAAELATEARKLLDSVSDKMEPAKAKEVEARFDTMMTDHGKIELDIAREEKLEAAERSANALDNRVPLSNKEAAAEARKKTPEYSEVFEKQLRFGAGSLDSEERSILQSGMTSFGGEQRAQGTAPDSAGGYTVPTEFQREIDKAMALWGPMWDANIVREVNTGTGADLEWPTVDDTAQVGEQLAENTAATDDGTGDVVFGQKVFRSYLFDTKVVRTSLQLMQDSAFNMQSVLNELFGERLGRRANTELTVGTGAGSAPEGIVTAANSGVTAVGAAAVTMDEILDLIHSVDPAYRQSPKCRFQFNDTTLLALKKLKDGQDNYLWQMGDVRTGEPNTLQGYGYSINQAMADLATTETPIIFGDHSRYIVRKVIGFQMMTLRERYAEFFQVGNIGFKRFDGGLLNANAVKKITMA